MRFKISVDIFIPTVPEPDRSSRRTARLGRRPPLAIGGGELDKQLRALLY